MKKYIIIYLLLLMFIPENVSAMRLEATFHSFDITNKSYRDLSDRIPYNTSGMGTSANVGYTFPTQFKFTQYDVTDFATGNFKFWGGVFDGTNIWMVPSSSNYLLKVNPTTGSMSEYDYSSYGDIRKFAGGVFDGENIWMVPLLADDIVKFNPSNPNVRETFDVSSYVSSLEKFSGAVFDGNAIWLVPRRSDYLLKVDVNTNAITSFPVGSTYVGGEGRYWGGTFDGRYVWMVPYGTNQIMRIDTTNDSVSYIDVVVDGSDRCESTACGMIGGIFDGENVWFFPHSGTSILKINPKNNNMKNIDVSMYNQPGHFSITESFDGRNIWIIPCMGYDFIRFNPEEEKVLNTYNVEDRVTGTFSAYMYSDMVYDGKDIWIIPGHVDQLIRMSPLYSIITENSFDDNGYRLEVDKTKNVEPGALYKRNCPLISGYKVAGYKINDGNIEEGEDIFIDGVLDDYEVTCIYSGVTGTYFPEDPPLEEEIINPRTGVADYLIPVISFVITSIIGIIYVKRKSINNL